MPVCLADSLHKASLVSVCIECSDHAVTRMIITVSVHGWHMVRADRTFKSDVIVRFHRFIHIDLAFIMETFFKLKLSTLYISEVYKMNYSPFTEVSDNR